MNHVFCFFACQIWDSHFRVDLLLISMVLCCWNLNPKSTCLLYVLSLGSGDKCRGLFLQGWLRDDLLETALTMGKTQKGQWGMTFTSTCSSSCWDRLSTQEHERPNAGLLETWINNDKHGLKKQTTPTFVGVARCKVFNGKGVCAPGGILELAFGYGSELVYWPLKYILKLLKQKLKCYFDGWVLLKLAKLKPG